MTEETLFISVLFFFYICSTYLRESGILEGER